MTTRENTGSQWGGGIEEDIVMEGGGGGCTGNYYKQPQAIHQSAVTGSYISLVQITDNPFVDSHRFQPGENY